MFDLERAIAEWMKSLRRNKAVQDGDRVELEGYLREKIDDLVAGGMSEEEAFRKATGLFLADGVLDKEYLRARSRRGTPHGGPWFLPDLVWNYWKIAWRKIRQDKGYAALAIGSLALAMTVGLSILIWARYEWSYDRFHKNGPDIFRFIYQKTTPSGVMNNYVSMPLALSSAVKSEFPEVRAVARVCRFAPQTRFETPRLLDFRSSIAFVDPEFLTMFDFPLVQGDPRSALANPKSVLLTESAARRFFGPDDPIGKTLMVRDEKIPMTVTGVLKDIPENSHIDFDLMMPWADFSVWEKAAGKEDDWFTILPILYVQLTPGANPSALAEKASRVVRKNDTKPGEKTLFLQPLREIHLHPERSERDFLSTRRSTINASQIETFLLIAAAVLLMGCINYTNLAAARSLKRAKEIGIRKAAGAGRGDLIRQFLGESVVFAFLAMIAAVAAAAGLGLPILRRLTGLSLDVSLLPKAELVLIFIGLALLIGAAAGMYPALFISSFPPVRALRQKFAPRGKSLVRFRKALVAVQIVCAGTLTGVIFVLVLQLRFIDRKDLGYDRSGLISISTWDQARLPDLKNALLSHPSVLGAATGFLPRMRAEGHFPLGQELSWEGKAADSQVKMDWHFVDENYLTTYGLELAAGRFFSGPSDKNDIVLNESAVAAMGLKDPVGKVFRVQKTEGRIIGVVKDFHVGTLKAPIGPMFFRYLAGYFGLTVRIDPRNTEAALRHITGVMKTYLREEPFSYEFLDDILRRMYAGDRLDARVVGIFGVIAVLISCLGLFGLISFAAEQRTKEIGIRKVLGASVGRIIGMMASDLAGLVAVAVLFAGPIWYWIAGRWLSSFAYRIRLDIWIFAASGLLVFGLALAAMSFRALRAAAGNPVDTLRYE
jgi:putative ABC transport system permease protein